MYFNIECIGKLPGPTNELEQSLVFETGEFERPKFDCSTNICAQFLIGTAKVVHAKIYLIKILQDYLHILELTGSHHLATRVTALPPTIDILWVPCITRVETIDVRREL